MHRRRLLLGAAPFIVFLMLGSLYIGRDHFSTSFSRPIKHLAHEPVKNDTILSSAHIIDYLDAIFKTRTTAVPVLECPAIDTRRYDPLRSKSLFSGRQMRYLFALNLRNCVALLPRLIGSIVEAAQFLGPESCALSIVEGDSPDGTADVLAALRPRLDEIGLTYRFESSEVHSAEGNRIEKLAQLRNMPLELLLEKPLKSIAEDASVIFLNDVAACPEDILELALQRQALNADMTCAMDWSYAASDPTFYDVWIARGINGDSFFQIPADGNWNLAWSLFWNAPDTMARFQLLRPFQVFACWNGAAVFSAQPILDGLRFRSANDTAGECFQGEPVLFCKDLWYRGFGKIAVIPSVNLGYDETDGKKIKAEKGYASEIVAKQDLQGNAIDWKLEPPESVRCMPTWSNQFWEPWNKSLV